MRNKKFHCTLKKASIFKDIVTGHGKGMPRGSKGLASSFMRLGQWAGKVPGISASTLPF